jgi:hypothetical protein
MPQNKITKSLGANLRAIEGNGLITFLDDKDSILKLKDVYGNIEPFSTYVSGSSTNYNGSFFSTATQTTVGNEIKTMTLTNTDISNGVSLVSGSQLKVDNAGVYNIQFSAQITKTQGGSAQNIVIWFRKNGQNISNSSTAITLANNNDLLVPSWNFFSQMNATDYLQVMWYTTDNHIQLVASNDTSNYPAVPSVIVTMNKV